MHDAAVLLACGVDADDRRDGLGGSVLLSEAEGHRRTSLIELKDRGLYGMELIVRDDIDIFSLHATDTLMRPLPRGAGLSNACLKGAPLFGASQPALFAGDCLFLLAAALT